MDGLKQNNIPGLEILSVYRLENLFKVYNDGTNNYYNLLNTVNIPDNLDSSVYTLYTVPNDTMSWTNISYLNYGTMELWWLICCTNNIRNPVQFPKANTTLKIIIPSVVSNILSTIKQT